MGLKIDYFSSCLLSKWGHEICERICFGEDLFLIKILIEGHGLHEIPHPFFTKIPIGELQIDGTLYQHHLDEIEVFLPVASDLLYIIYTDCILNAFIWWIWVDF